MSRNVLAGLTVAVFCMMALATAAQAADARIVFINLDRVFNEFYKTEIADAQLKEQAEEFNTERKAMVEALRKLQDDFNAARDEAQNTALSEEVRSDKRNEAEEKLIEMREEEGKIRRLDESRRKQLEDQGRRMRKRIVEEISGVITTHAKNEGFTAVVDSSGQSLNGVELILYTDVKFDITDDVLEILNRGRQDAGDKPATQE
ncbi:MAG: OmpH family outer membrane protein [Kiritimatiellae bacterium]|nr:OmpH family outer membrane protein [Kiritimatiellia bacterium]